MKDLIRNYFQTNKEKVTQNFLNLLSQLISVKTVNPGKENLSEHPYIKVPGEESKAVEVLKKYFDSKGINYTVHERTAERANLIATYGKGEKSLCIGCHLDVVPAGDESLWDTEPFTMTEKNGKVYGRGVLDNKGPMVSCILAIEALKNINAQLQGRLMLAAIAGEEFHEKDEPDPGIEFLIEEGVLKPNFAIIPDIGHNMKKIDIAEKGRLVIKVISIGKQAHGSTPEKGINAISKLAEYITKADKLELVYHPHKFLIKPTINLGIVKGGAAANIVPGRAEATFDIRYLPGQTAEGIIEEFKTCARNIDEGKFEFEVESNMPPHEITPDNILVKTIQENAKDILGFVPEPFGMGGGTFAKAFNLGNIQAVGFGPGDDNAFHTSNEYLEIKQAIQFAELIACIAIDLLNN